MRYKPALVIVLCVLTGRNSAPVAAVPCLFVVLKMIKVTGRDASYSLIEAERLYVIKTWKF